MSALVGFSGAPRPRALAAMAEPLRHRGSSAIARIESPRLSAVLTAHDSAEACFEEGDAGRVLLAGQLLNPPASLLDAWREDQWASLRGSFVAVVESGSELVLIRDGAGARTLYYGELEGRLLFAVEPKGVLAWPGFPRRLRPAALAQYLCFSFVPSGGTMLRDLHELPAGHRLRFRDGAATLERWFHFEAIEAEDDPARADEWVERTRDVVSAAIRDRVPKSGATTVFLSGGLDSSLVTAELARQSVPELRAFAIHFGERYPNELPFARAVAERSGVPLEIVEVLPRAFLPRLRRMVWHLDEPIGDPITMPNFELADRARGHSRYVFNGEGGDPLFGGPKNVGMLLQHWYGGVPRDDTFRERAYLASYRRGYEELRHVLSPELQAELDFERDLVAVLRPFFEAERPRSFLNKLMAINVRLKGAHLILPKVERMLGAHGMVPLSPLFDERLLRLAFEMPPRMKLRGGVEKIALKRAFESMLPSGVVERPKSGMRVPVHFWFQGELKRYAAKILSRRELKRVGLFDAERVQQLLRYQTEEGPGRYGIRLWMLLTFEIWRRLVIEGESV